MPSNTVSPRSSPGLTPPPQGLKALKATVDHEKISPPAGRTISSVQSLAKYLKECDPEITWLQTKEQQNVFLQHARDAVMRHMDKKADGQYSTTWAKTGAKKRAVIIDHFTDLEPGLVMFKDQWVAELFLGKCIKTKNVTRKTRNESEPLDEGT